MQDPIDDTKGTSHRALVAEYAALRLAFTALHAQPHPDPAAIDAAMRKMDVVQMALKQIDARPDDPQRF